MDTSSSGVDNTLKQKTDLPNNTSTRFCSSSAHHPIQQTSTSEKVYTGDNSSSSFSHSKITPSHFISQPVKAVRAVSSSESTANSPENGSVTCANKAQKDCQLKYPPTSTADSNYNPASNLGRSKKFNPASNSLSKKSTCSKLISAKFIASELICLRCNELLKEPLLTPCCTKNFCSPCLLPDIISKKTCPFCLKFPIDVQKLSISGEIADKLSSLEAPETREQSGLEIMRILSSKTALKERSVLNMQLPTMPATSAAKLNDKQLFNEGVAMMAKTQNDYPLPSKSVNKDLGGVLNDHDCLSHLNSESVKLLVVGDSKKQHDCVDHVTKLIQGLQMRVTSLETEVKTRHSKYSKREKSLLSKVATLQNEAQVQAVHYQAKINTLTSQLYFAKSPHMATHEEKQQSSNDANDQPETFEVTLLRDENGSFGFNISGGHREDNLSCPIFVSKVSGQSIQGSPQHSPLQTATLALTQLQLNDQIIKVNNVDLNGSTHEEAVQIIKNSLDPVQFTIVRHVIPPDFANSLNGSVSKNEMQTDSQKEKIRVCASSTVACQTDPYLSFLSASDWYDGDLPPLPSFVDDPELWGSMTDIETITCDTQLLDHELHQQLQQDNTTPGDSSLSASDDVIASLLQINNYDFEYEEVVLEKSSPDEKLGITVCKGAPNTTFSQLFVSKVEDSSLAAIDGRVSMGDQIVRINGKDVSDTTDIGKLFEVSNGENSSSLKITLLISRPLFSAKPSIFDLCEVEEQTLEEMAANQSEASSNSVAEESRSEGFENIYEEPQTPTIRRRNKKEDADTRDRSGVKETGMYFADKDSGLDCDSSVRNDSLSETGDHDRTRSFTGESGIYTAESIFSSENTEYPFVSSGTAKKLTRSSLMNAQQQQVISKPVISVKVIAEKPTKTEIFPDDATTDSFNMSIDEASLPFTDEDENVYENVDHILPEEDENRRSVSPPPLPRPNLMRREAANQYQNIPLAKDKNRKTFANENCNMLSPSFDERRAQLDLDFETVKGIREKGTLKLRKQMKTLSRESVMDERDYATICSTAPPNTPLKTNQNVPEVSRKYLNARESAAQKSSRSFQEFNKRFSERSKIRRNDSMLSIPTHAKQYRSYLQLVKLHEQQQDRETLASEWKVKIRPDGSRYIAKVNTSNTSLNSSSGWSDRKANRAKVLRDRTEKLNNERASGCLTTDDEAASELKVGRYWSREERTRQYMISQEKKMRKQMMENSRNQFLDESLNSTLKRKRMMAQQAALATADKNKILDTFITIQEIMTHGSNLHSNPLLSVTTV